MNTTLESINGAGLKFVELALPILIQSSLLIIILLAADLLVRKKVRAVFRYWIWMLVLIKLILPASLHSPLSIGSWFGEQIEYANVIQQDNKEDIGQKEFKSEKIENIESETQYFTPTNRGGENSIRLQNEPVNETITPSVAANPDTTLPESIAHENIAVPASKSVKISWQAVIFIIWITIAAMLALIVLKRTIFIRELVIRASDSSLAQIKAISPKDMLRHCCICLGFKKQIPLKISPDATSPVVCGLLQPVILLPQNLITSLSPEQLKAIFFHELAHIRRCDLWVNLLQTLLQVIYFYNPLLWLANSIIRRTREQAVDEMVLVAMGKNAAEYPETLVSVAKLAFKRPALSLRLIGVVESEDALSGRIKHMLNHPIPKTAKLGLLGLLVIIILAAILLPMSRIAEPKMSVINNGPLDIRLISIRPDSGDMLYDPNGRKMGKLQEFAVAHTDSWNPESQCRDFIFEVPELQNQLIFAPFQKISNSENSQPLGGGFRGIYDEINKTNTLTYSVSFSRSYRRNILPFLNVNKTINYIDFSLRYYYGPRKEALCTFTGPFSFDTSIKAQENQLYELTFQRSISFYDSGLEMHFKTSQPFNSNTQVLIYDKQGKRYTTNQSTGGGGSSGADQKYFSIPLSIDEITAVTFGEKPYEITFKNVKVQYKNTPPRIQPEYLDIMAQRLNLVGRTPDQLRQYRFNNHQEAIDVIDIIRSQWHIRAAFDAIQMSNPRIRIPELDEETHEKLRKAATQWASSSYVENFGLELGLMGKWPEFLDMAIERLSKDVPKHFSAEMEQRWRQDNSSIANAMINYRLGELTPEQIQKLKRLALSTDNDTILTYIFRYLQNIKSQESTDALWELVQDDRPWIWFKAMNIWYPRVNQNRMYETLPDEIKIKRILTNNNLSDEKLNTKADELLKQIFTPEFGKIASSEWNEIRTKISQKLDKKEATEIYINYLRQLKNTMTTHLWIIDTSFRGSAKWETAYIIRALNVWYGINIGNLGTDEMRGSGDVGPRNIVEPRNILDFQDLITEALKWYDENKNIEPVELAFTGKVVDTSGKPIASAKIIFTKMEDYQDARGFKNQRRVEAALIATDANGIFSVVLPPKERWYELNVAADGFLTRERIMVDRLDDGRYRFREYNSQQDNVFIMLRPGRISGIVLGVDGKPLAGAELELFANYHYSESTPRKTVTTDSQGKFDVNGIASDPMLLSYTRLNQVPQERTSRQEYGGLSGAVIIENKEGQEQTGIVLDLSKSVCSLELEVKDKAGKPVDSINLYFDIKMPPGSGYLYNTVFYSKEENSDGIYKFNGLPPGKWLLRISDGDNSHRELDLELSPQTAAIYQIDFGAKYDEAAKMKELAKLLAREKAAGEAEENKTTAQDANESKWGEAVEGAQIRIVDAVNIFGRSDWPHAVARLRLEAKNNGQRYLHLPENGLRWQIEVDGRWFEWVSPKLFNAPNDSNGIIDGEGSVLLDFNPGNSHKDLKTEIAGNWRQIPEGKENEFAKRRYSGSGWIVNKDEYGSELVLESGKHTIRTAITCPPSRRGLEFPGIYGPIHLISNPIEFEILPKEEKSDANILEAEEKGVNIYLLADETIDSKTAAAQPLSELVLRDRPWISSQDIEMYDVSSHCVYLKKERPQFPSKITSQQGNPFVLTTNGQKCYLGTVWPAGSSSLPERTLPVIDMTDFILMPPDIVRIRLSGLRLSSDETQQIQNKLNDPRIIKALKENGQYHAGLEMVLDKVEISKTGPGSSLSYTYTLINKDVDDLYIFDPNKMGTGLFHYFNNCPSLLPEGGGSYISGDNDKIVEKPESTDKFEKSWFSLLKSGQSLTRTVTIDTYPEIKPGKYECKFWFHSPNARLTKDQRAQFDKRVWMGQIEAKLSINVTMSNETSNESAQIKEKDLELRLLEEIRVGSRDLKFTDQAKSLIKELSDLGVDVVSLLLEEYKTPTGLIVVRNTVILEALKEIRSDQAKKVLFELAFYHISNAGNLGMRAAQAYVAIESDGSKIAQLLESPEDGVSDIASEALVGKTLNLEITKALGKQLNSKTRWAHIYVPEAFAKDNSVVLADEKIDFLLNSFSNLKNIENSERQAYGSVWTESETAFNNYVQAISKIQGGEQVLRSRIARADSLQREAIIIALALRKSTDVHNDLIKIIQKTKDEAIRALAITGLGQIGEITDIDMLQKLSDSDTFTRMGHYGLDSYPVREAAKEAIRDIKQRY